MAIDWRTLLGVDVTLADKLNRGFFSIDQALRDHDDDLEALDTAITDLAAEVAAGGAPTGAAGGDLDGTYPNPSVAAITETSGPDQLTIGDINDGEFLKRDGSDLVSAVPPPYGWECWFRRDPGGSLDIAQSGTDDPTDQTSTPLHVAGRAKCSYDVTQLHSGNTTAMQGGGLVDALYAIPQVLPAGSIIRLLTAFRGGTGVPQTGARTRLGVYANANGSGNMNLYPGTLLYDSGELNAESNSNYQGGAATSVAVTAGLYWFVATGNSLTTPTIGDISMLAIPQNTVWPILGGTVRFGNGELTYNDSAGIGWRHAQSFGALPSTFPSSAPRRLVVVTSGTSVDIPAIMFGFDPA